MEELLHTFLETYFSEELKDEITKSFDLFDFFEYKQAYAGLNDIMNEYGTMSTDDLQDRFIAEINSKLDFVLKEHTIVLIDSATISQKNEILASLAHIQKLEDYTGIIRILESLIDDDEQLAIILSDSTLMDKSEVLSIIQSFNPSMLQTLKQYIYQKEEQTKDSQEPNYKLVENFKIFNEFSSGKGIGSRLISSGTLFGDRFSVYLPFVEDDLLVPNNVDATALNILSLLFISIDGYNSALLVYRKYSYQILKDLLLVSKVETSLLNYIGQYTEFKKAYHDTQRLLETGTTA